ncbi:hypothetical protein ACGFNU_29845 [Spirillospora sp. NPDC048911]|uniref:hypothetical protein n=1 Tax=Spirillospora sp. NPDC048911 TaxID=3364527 RepID=UPI0037190192
MRKLRDDLVKRLNARCIPKDEAIPLIEGRIKAYGLTGWGVRVPPDFDRHGRCTSFGLDEPQKKVFIIGMSSVN